MIVITVSETHSIHLYLVNLSPVKMGLFLLNSFPDTRVMAISSPSCVVNLTVEVRSFAEEFCMLVWLLQK